MDGPDSTSGLSLVDIAALVEGSPTGSSGPDDEVARIRRAHVLVQRSHECLNESVTTARSHGVSWQAIGDVLGVSRQAAFKRFSNLSPTGEMMSDHTVDLMDRTHEVFQHLDAGDYDAVRAHMTYTTARLLSKRKLMGVWNEVVTSSGRLQGCSDSTVQTPDGSTKLNKLANRHLINGPIVQTTLQHEAGEWIGRVAYNGSGKITGILVAPVGAQDLPF